MLATLDPIIQRDNPLKEALILILRKGIFAKYVFNIFFAFVVASHHLMTFQSNRRETDCCVWISTAHQFHQERLVAVYCYFFFGNRCFRPRNSRYVSP
jgi:hypothetical protein